MKFLTLAALAATANANILEAMVDKSEEAALRGSDLNFVVKHGMLDDQHCEELWIPAKSYKSFWADDGWKYPTYVLCFVFPRWLVYVVGLRSALVSPRLVVLNA